MKKAKQVQKTVSPLAQLRDGFRLLCYALRLVGWVKEQWPECVSWWDAVSSCIRW